MELNVIQMIAVSALPFLFAITGHEAAHAYAAKKLGDPTAFLMGRMTFNPIKHIDPIGTVLLPLLCYLIPGSFMFGYAKPVPVDFHRLKNPKKDMRWVAAAGPIANLVMAIFWALLLKMALSTGMANNTFQLPLKLMATEGIRWNVILMIINLIPIPPLDGGRILVSILPNNASNEVMKLEPYGIFIVLALLISPLGAIVIAPFMSLVLGFLSLIV